MHHPALFGENSTSSFKVLKDQNYSIEHFLQVSCTENRNLAFHIYPCIKMRFFIYRLSVHLDTLILLKTENNKKNIFWLLFIMNLLFIGLITLFMSHEQCNRRWTLKKKKQCNYSKCRCKCSLPKRSLTLLSMKVCFWDVRP